MKTVSEALSEMGSSSSRNTGGRTTFVHRMRRSSVRCKECMRLGRKWRERPRGSAAGVLWIECIRHRQESAVFVDWTYSLVRWAQKNWDQLCAVSSVHGGSGHPWSQRDRKNSFNQAGRGAQGSRATSQPAGGGGDPEGHALLAGAAAAAQGDCRRDCAARGRQQGHDLQVVAEQEPGGAGCLPCRDVRAGPHAGYRLGRAGFYRSN